MGQPIKRATLGAIAKEYEARGNVGAPQQEPPQPFNPGAVFFGVNDRSTPILPGDSIVILDAFPNRNASYANLYKQVLRNKVKVNVCHGAYASTDQSRILGVAITPARQHHICQFKSTSGGLYYANVYCPDQDYWDDDVYFDAAYDYVDVNGVGTNGGEGENAPFAKILAGCYISANGYAVALCERIAGAGGNQELQASVVSNELVLELV